MKVQTGMRLDSLLWCDFKKLCEKLHVRPNEPFEAFLEACVGRGDLGSVLDALRAQSPSEKLANELKRARWIRTLGFAQTFFRVMSCLEPLQHIYGWCEV